MKFDTCAVRVSLSKVWAVSWAWKMWKVHVQKEQQQQRTMKGTKGREGKEAKLQWMKNQLGACNFENALGGLSWLTDWMNDLTARTTDCRLLNCRLVKRLTAPLTSWTVSTATTQLVKLMFAYQKIAQQLQKNTSHNVRYNIEFWEIRYKCCHNTILLVLSVLCALDNNV